MACGAVCPVLFASMCAHWQKTVDTEAYEKIILRKSLNEVWTCKILLSRLFLSILLLNCGYRSGFTLSRFYNPT